MKKIYALLITLFCFFCASAQVNQLWGLTSTGGGPDSGGTIVKINLSGNNFSVAYPFDSASGVTPNGSLMMAPNGLLFGTTEDGGALQAGVIFSYDPLTNIYTDVFDFDYDTTGAFPDNSLVMATDGKLYGVASGGGANGDGTLFRIDPNTTQFTLLYSFSDSVGRYPYGYLTQANDGKLYGLASEGGVDTMGTLFSYDITNSTYSVLHSFSLATGTIPNGSLVQASNGNLYGMTSEGGLYNWGTVFSYNPADSIYTDVYDFNDTSGATPFGSLINTVEGLLYGMASDGGANHNGVIFSFDATTNFYSDVFDFSGANGASPNGELMQASDNKLYGMTPFGGTNDDGVIFVFDQAALSLGVLHDFSYSDGTLPFGDLIEMNSTGIPVLKNVENIQLYPNPADKQLVISITANGAERMDICNVLGEKVYEQELMTKPEMTIDVSGLLQGVYFVNIYSGQSKQVRKFVKE